MSYYKKVFSAYYKQFAENLHKLRNGTIMIPKGTKLSAEFDCKLPAGISDWQLIKLCVNCDIYIVSACLEQKQGRSRTHISSLVVRN